MVQERYTDRHMPRLLNLNGAADLLGVSAQYVHRLAEREELPGLKLGSSWIFRRVVVERLRERRDQEKKNAPQAE